VSAAVRLCQAAEAAGIALDGAQFTLVGEPITAVRLDRVRRGGANAVPEYGSAEVGTLGEACHAPETADDVHLMDDLVAVIQPDERGQTDISAGTKPAPIPSGGLLVTSLRPTSPLMLLNYSMGDRATMVRRSCGCPMEAYGWTTHLHTVRSFEKLTSEGVTFADTDVIHVLDEVLPRRFGGGPTDYQLVEGESEDGRAAITLRVHPRVGPLNETMVRDAFLMGVGRGSGIEAVMERVWREADLVRVERRPPEIQTTGKILHFAVKRPSSTGPGPGATSP
jgi:hypothetical protein